MVLGIGLIIVYRLFFIPSGIDIDKNIYPVTGIDVSKHSGNIDFAKVKEQRINFVYLKASEGENYVDEKFEKNFAKAKLNNLPTGAYHFFRFNKSGISQASNFLNTVNNKKTELPYVLDIEEWGQLGSFKKDTIINEIGKFLRQVKKITPKKIMIYTNESGFHKFIEGHFDEYALWICSFSNPPRINKTWALWQHSHKGKLEGVEGHVDVNTFNGSTDEWRKFLKK